MSDKPKCASCGCPIENADHYVCDPCFYGPRMTSPRKWDRELKERRERYGWNDKEATRC